jgi:hypothetical protein
MILRGAEMPSVGNAAMGWPMGVGEVNANEPLMRSEQEFRLMRASKNVSKGTKWTFTLPAP